MKKFTIEIYNDRIMTQNEGLNMIEILGALEYVILHTKQQILQPEKKEDKPPGFGVIATIWVISMVAAKWYWSIIDQIEERKARLKCQGDQ